MDEWRKELQNLYEQEGRYKKEQRQLAEADAAASDARTKEAKEFIQNTIVPVFNELAAELKKYVKKAWWDGGDLDTHLRIQFENGGVLTYTIDLRAGTHSVTAQRRCKVVGPSGRPSYEHTSPLLAKYDGLAYNTTEENEQQAGVLAITKHHIINDFMTEYKHYKHGELYG